MVGSPVRGAVSASLLSGQRDRRLHVRFADFARILAFALIAGATPLSAAPNAARVQQPAARDDFAKLVDIGHGRRLWLECRGSGSPIVILESGYRTAAVTWTEDLEQPDAPRTMVLRAIAARTRVCTYERPGGGRGAARRLPPEPQ